MLRSSLGFHTMTLDMSLTATDAHKLLLDFVAYSKTKALKMYQLKERKYITYFPSPNYLPMDVKIYFDGKYKGIHWHIYVDDRFSGMVYIIETTINPKFLAGITDYLTAATYGDMNIAIFNFNDESKKISSLLGTFNDYRIKRVDYCINICLNDFMPTCAPGQIVNLIKRSDIPSHYKEWMVYDNIAHRMKSRPESFYLCSKSVNINCYSKYLQLLNRSQENIKRGSTPIPPEIIDASRNIIRFEVQCKYHKTYSLNKKAEESGNNCVNKYKDILAPVTYIEIISTYYEKIIGKGDWYTLPEAVQIIQSKKFNSQKEKRFIDALKHISQCRSLAKAKSSFQDNELTAFKKTLNELAALNINPVTIPREWNIKHIPNFLRAYFDELINEFSAFNILHENLCTIQGYLEYCEKFKHRPI